MSRDSKDYTIRNLISKMTSDDRKSLINRMDNDLSLESSKSGGPLKLEKTQSPPLSSVNQRYEKPFLLSTGKG